MESYRRFMYPQWILCYYFLMGVVLSPGESSDIPLHLLKELSLMTSDQVSSKYNIARVSAGGSSKIVPLLLPPEEAPIAENAACAPREIVVLMPKLNTSLVVHPVATKVKRCTGACGHENLLCKPAKTRTLMRKGLLFIYKNGGLLPLGYQTFALEEHINCTCDCQQKAEDCRSNQRYLHNNCQCACKKQDRKNNCPSDKSWDHAECRCRRKACSNISSDT